MNTDTLSDIMLNLPYSDLINMCLVYQLSNKVCGTDFWKRKIQYDYNIIPKSTNYKKEYKKLYDIQQKVNQMMIILPLVNKNQLLNMTLSKGHFYDQVYEIYFSYLKPNQYEISFLSEGSQEVKLIGYDDLIQFMIKMFYDYPDINITEGQSYTPILYKDLLKWETFIFKDLKEKRLALWKNVLNI